MTKAVIFDLDGTLLDTLADLAASVNYALQSHHLPQRSVQEVRSFLGNGIKALMQKAVGADVRDDVFDPVFQTFRRHYMEHCLDTTEPYPGINQLLSAFQDRGVKMAIVSNKLQPAVSELRERFFASTIPLAVGESPDVRRKPCPDSVLAALRALEVSPHDALYVGDSEVDLATAQNAGVRCTLVAWGFRDEPYLRALPGAERIIHHPSELLSEVTEQP